MRKLLLLSFLLIIWVTSIFLINSYTRAYEVLGWYSTLLTVRDIHVVLAFILLFHASEFLLLLSSIWSIRHIFNERSGSVRFAMEVLLFGSLSAYQLILGASWIFASSGGVFLGVSDFNLLAYLADLGNIFTLGTQGDYVSGFSVLALALVATIFLFTSAKILGKSKEELAVVTIALLAATAALGAYILLSFPIGKKYDVAKQIRNSVSPQFAVLADSLFRGNISEAHAQLDTTTLIRAEGLDEYLQRIPPNYAPKRNILLIVIEALRHDVVEKHRDNMPQLAHFADNGVHYERAFAQANDTDYSFRTLITGLHPRKLAYRDLLGDTSYPYLRIYDLLALSGYRTGLFVVEWQLTKRISSSEHLEIHYDPQFNVSDSSLAVSAGPGPLAQHLHTSLPPSALDDMAVGKLIEWVSNPSHKPFFGTLYLYGSHFPYKECSVDGSDEQHRPSFFAVPEQDIIQALKQSYLSCLTLIDAHLGRIKATLSEMGLLDSTTIIITGDHGEEFGEHGNFAHTKNLYNPTLQVPIIIWNLEESHRALPLESVVSHLDVPPTILSIAGLPQTAAFQGTSLLDKTAELPTISFATSQTGYFLDSIIRWPHKLIENHRLGLYQLFNLESDPGETTDLANLEPEVFNELRAELNKFIGTQLGYYKLEKEVRNSFFPPKPPRVAPLNVSARHSSGA